MMKGAYSSEGPLSLAVACRVVVVCPLCTPNLTHQHSPYISYTGRHGAGQASSA